MSFYLSGHPDDTLRLKSFSAATKGKKTVLRIELETDSPWDLASALEGLGEVQAGQRQIASKPSPSRGAAKPLALPSPQLALPQPKDR